MPCGIPGGGLPAANARRCFRGRGEGHRLVFQKDIIPRGVVQQVAAPAVRSHLVKHLGRQWVQVIGGRRRPPPRSIERAAWIVGNSPPV